MTVPVKNAYVWFNTDDPNDPGQLLLENPKVTWSNSSRPSFLGVEIPWPDQWDVVLVETSVVR